MIVLCYHENEAQVQSLLESEVYQGYKRVIHSEVQPSMDTIVAETTKIAGLMGIDLTDKHPILLHQNFLQAFSSMEASEENILYTVQVVYQEKNIPGGPKVSAPTVEGYMPSVASLMMVSALVTMHGDKVDIMNMNTSFR